MKVLIVSNCLIKKDKDELYCMENLYHILKRFSSLGELTLCALPYTPQKTSNVIESCLSEFVKCENVFFIKKNHIKTDYKTKEILKKCVQESDLVIGYVPCINAYTALKYAKEYNKKYMSYVVGCPWDSLWNHSFSGKCLAPKAFFQLKRCLKKTDYALYVTEHFLQKRYPSKGIVCGCSDVRIPETDEDVLIHRLNLLNTYSDHQIFNIVTIASYSVRYKGQHYVIRALAKLKKKGICKYHYYLIGSGDKTRLEKLAVKLGVAEQVHFEGIVPHSHIFEKLDEMHIYIQPSLQEGLPRAVVEAMSRGLLCICANTAAMPEMVDSKYVVNRKSVNDIVDLLNDLSIENLKDQAIRNFEEAKKYDDQILDLKRNAFFKKVKKDVESNIP